MKHTKQARRAAMARWAAGLSPFVASKLTTGEREATAQVIEWARGGRVIYPGGSMRAEWISVEGGL